MRNQALTWSFTRSWGGHTFRVCGDGIETGSRRGCRIPDNENQAKSERRQRIIQTAMALAAEGGYDAVIMRDLADQANVALGTLYNYFASKDHLLAAAWVEWVRDLEQRMGGRPAEGETPADRVMEVLRRVCTALGRQPKLVSAILAAATSNTAEVAQCQDEVRDMLYGMIDRALDLGDPDLEERVNQVLGHVLFAALLYWVNGRTGIDEVVASLDTTAHLLLDPRPA